MSHQSWEIAILLYFIQELLPAAVVQVKKFQPTTQKSHKIFHMTTGETTAASMQAKLYHDVREPTKTVDMVPQLKHNSLISGGKFADANYITVLTPTEVLIYEGNDTHISVSKE